MNQKVRTLFSTNFLLTVIKFNLCDNIVVNFVASPFSIVLKEVVVPLWRHDDCENKLQRNFGSSYKLAETAICAGELGHDACDVNDDF